MGRFEEELGWILMRFRKGDLNFAETTIKIEELIIRCLGFSLLHFEKFDEILKWAEENRKETDEHNQTTDPGTG